MPVINGITVYDLARDLTESASLREPTSATKSYYVPRWTDRYTVANGLIGATNYTGRTVSFVPPLRYPDSNNLSCMDVSIRGVGKFSNGPYQIAWESAIISCHFSLPNFNVSLNVDPGGYNSFDPAAPLIYATQSLDYGAQVVEIPKKALKYAGGGALNVGFGLFVPIVTMNLTLHRLPYMPPIATRSVAGNVNQYTFWGCARGRSGSTGSRPIASSTWTVRSSRKRQ